MTDMVVLSSGGVLPAASAKDSYQQCQCMISSIALC
jgi:hypothetical protein